jgi:MFS transporter, DHA1 family, tetracycline resistance protein
VAGKVFWYFLPVVLFRRTLNFNLMHRARSPLTIIFLTIFIDLLGFGLVIPVLPFYAESYGATPLTVGFLAMSYSLMQFIFAPFWGRISDRIGRRPIILLGLAGSCIAFLMFGLAQSLVMLFVARALAGLLTSASLPAAQAFIADSTTPENRAKGMGLIGAAFGLGFIFGPAMGGLLTKYGYSTPAFVASALTGLNFIWAVIQLPESHPHQNRRITPHYLSPSQLKLTFGDPRLAFLLAIFFVHFFAFASMESTFALFNEHQVGLKAFGVGALLAEVGIIAALIQGVFTGKLTKKFGEITLAISGIFLMGLGLLLTAFTHTISGMMMVVPLYALGSALSNPSLASLISRCASPERQGITMGTSQGIGALGRVLGPLFGTWLFQRYAPAAPYYAGAAIMALIWLATLIRLRPTVTPVLDHAPAIPD